MKRAFFGTLCGAALATVAAGVQAADPPGYTHFKTDVNAAIDAGLAYSRANSYFTVFNYANGLSLLTLLEKQTVQAGYNGLSPTDKVLAQNAACLLIDDGNFGDRGGFYAYFDGQVMMALSLYLDTGGPDSPTGASPYDCSGRSARATIDKVVDRSLATQSGGTPTQFGCAGYWVYQGPGCDSSTTQYTLAGLSAAKTFYSSKGESLDKNRIGLITTALNLTAAGYAANGKADSRALFTNCTDKDGVAAGCLGHGYQANYGAGNNSSQQSASGTWGQLAGTGKNVNDATIQGYLRWLRNAYNYNTNIYPDQWTAAYLYFMWSSSKAFNIIEGGVAPVPGNIGPADMGTLPAGGGRLANRVPADDRQPPPRGSNLAGYYAGTPAGWYYDYAYRLMGLQQGSGYFPNPNGSFESRYAPTDHDYALLVLQRSIGSIFIERCDIDGDGDIDKLDTAAISKARGQPASGPADSRDANVDMQITVADVKVCIPRCTLPNCAIPAP